MRTKLGKMHEIKMWFVVKILHLSRKKSAFVEKLVARRNEGNKR